MLKFYLAQLGWHVQEVYGKSVLADLLPIVQKGLMNCPRRPMPHGKVNGHLWNFFPESCIVSEESFRELLLTTDTWTIFTDDSSEVAIEFRAMESNLDKLPSTDLYFVSDSLPYVLALDHQEFGPWCLRTDKRVKAVVWPERVIQPIVPDGLRSSLSPLNLTPAQMSTRIKKALQSKGIYVPKYKFRQNSVDRDNIWNYIPETFDVSEKTLPIIEFLASAQEELVFWIEGDSPYLMPSSKLRDASQIPDAYIASSLAMEWLLAIPEPYIRYGSRDSYVLPSFVVF